MSEASAPPRKRRKVSANSRKSEKALNIFDIPAGIKMKFKLRCVKEGKDMRQVVIEFMQRYARGEEIFYSDDRRK